MSTPNFDALRAERNRKVVEVEKAFVKAAGVMRNISKNLFARPKECLEEVGELVNQLVVAFLDQPEVALHVMGENPGSEETYYHGLNSSILAMMLAKELGFDRQRSQVLGVGALLHDIGLADIPERVARASDECPDSRIGRPCLPRRDAYRTVRPASPTRIANIPHDQP